MSGSIASTMYSLNHLHQGAYAFTIQFLDQKSSCVSQKQFTFKQECTVQEGEAWDVYSQNGSCTPTLVNDLFHGKDFKAISATLKKLPSPSCMSDVGIVLDLQGPDHKYISSEWHRRSDR